MATNEQPFDEREQRWFLAEILKVSSISPHDLLRLVRDKGINPNWIEMLMPTGRSVSACMRAYESLLRPSAAPTAPPTYFHPRNVTEELITASKPRPKRPPPDEGLGALEDRSIQAQTFTTVNQPYGSTYQFASPHPPATGEPHGRKRGRPNKEEHERRVREAAERGEVYPPPKKIKTPRHSVEGAGKMFLSPPRAVEAGTSDVGSAGKKRPEKKSPAAALAPEIPARNSSLEATAKAADPMQVDAKEDMATSIPEAQGSGIPAQERYMTGVPDSGLHKDLGGPQSSSVLKPESAHTSGTHSYSATSDLPRKADTTSAHPNPLDVPPTTTQ